MKTLIVTGGIGSGKSVLCRHLASRGVPVYDSDSRAKALYDEDPGLVPAVENALGMSLRGKDGSLDRNLLASVVFSDADRLNKLEAVVHPAVFRDFERWKTSFGEDTRYVVFESAIYQGIHFEGKPSGVVLLVDAPGDLRIRRACERDGVGDERIRARMSSQVTCPEMADAVIVNDGTVRDFLERADRMIEELINR